MTSRPTRSLATAVGIAALTLAGTSACGGSQQPAPSADGKVVVVASTNVWASVAQAVGGDAVSVRAILSDPGADPHGYEAKPSDATAFDGAAIALSNGGGYDDFFAGLADAAGSNPRRIVAVDLAPGHDDHDTHVAPAEPAPADAGHDHGERNEHVWYDLETVHKVADKLVQELVAVAPDKADRFRANGAAFERGIDDLTARVAAIGKAKPDTAVLATEPVAAYLLRSAGLRDATPAEFSAAVEEESDPSAAAVAETTALVTEKRVAAVVYNAQTESPVTKQLKEKAAASGVPVVPVTETLPQGVTGYLEWMTQQVDGIAKAVAA